MNQYVSEKTNGKINELIHPSDIQKLTNLILLNTLYFKAKWMIPFDPVKTRKRVFTTSTGTKKTLSVMQMLENVDYFENHRDNVHGIILPYKDSPFQLIAIMPEKGRDIMPAIKALAKGKLKSYLSSANQKLPTDILLPRLNMEYHGAMESLLQRAGLTSPFSDEADFSAMTAEKKYSISRVIHAARLELNEETAEGAAVTAVMIQIQGMSPCANSQKNTFHADRPFVIIVNNRENDSVLFAGLVNNPE